MDHFHRHDYATSNILTWTSHSVNVEPSAEEETGADADEPPDRVATMSPISNHFKRAPIRYGSEYESLLTKALHGHSDDDANGHASSLGARRRSMTSNISMASTADLSCSTGITTPARTCSPSPRKLIHEFGSADDKRAAAAAAASQRGSVTGPVVAKVPGTKVPVAPALEKKRCISFACTAKPKTDDRALMPPPPLPAKVAPNLRDGPKRTAIRFACPTKPSVSRTPPLYAPVLATTPMPSQLLSSEDEGSPVTVLLHRSPCANLGSRSLTPHRISQGLTVGRCKDCSATDLKGSQNDRARFHELSSGEAEEDHWMRRDGPAKKRRITIGDTLEKENAIRKLAKEVEDEAELEEEMEAGDDDEDQDDDDDEVNMGEEVVADDEIEEDDIDEQYYGSEDADDGYHTDNEVGFAASDDEDDGLVLWTTRAADTSMVPGTTPAYCQTSTQDYSDSSSLSDRPKRGHMWTKSREKQRARTAIRPGTPDLPDSTDFVCGTLDEDRPLEEAYISRVAQRKRSKTVQIPQDIDPSFPTSDPEDDEDGVFKNVYEDSGDDVWLHGELEDIHSDKDCMGRRKSSNAMMHRSPMRLCSPPPKRLQSPPPKAWAHPARKLPDRHSPRRLQSPPPSRVHTTSRSPQLLMNRTGAVFKAPALRPGLTRTKSLPRAPAVVPQRYRKGRKEAGWKDKHVRGAIDIVKGLEQKRQRRKEKFHQKYCERARKEKTHAHDRRPIPGLGAQRMKEIGLLMAGKIGQGNYVISV